MVEQADMSAAERSRQLIEESKQLVERAARAKEELQQLCGRAEQLRRESAFMRYMDFNKQAADFFRSLDERCLPR